MTPLEIEVVFAGKERIVAASYRLPGGARVADALACAARDPAFAAVDLSAPVGIHGRRAGPQDALHQGDRVEIYRPLEADPKAARRMRAQASPLNKSGRS